MLCHLTLIKLVITLSYFNSLCFKRIKLWIILSMRVGRLREDKQSRWGLDSLPSQSKTPVNNDHLVYLNKSNSKRKIRGNVTLSLKWAEGVVNKNINIKRPKLLVVVLPCSLYKKYSRKEKIYWRPSKKLSLKRANLKLHIWTRAVRAVKKKISSQEKIL